MFQRITLWMKTYRSTHLKVRVIEIRERLVLESARRSLEQHELDFHTNRATES